MNTYRTRNGIVRTVNMNIVQRYDTNFVWINFKWTDTGNQVDAEFSVIRTEEK